jgi:hypothetical protein|tara:strand:+ start:549 stop:1142 length:594 start_codon:yes stop_codon:yes gene_type:complete
MSDLKSLIRKSKGVKKELVASTVRIPRELVLFIEGLAERLDLSKQEVTLKLIEAGVEVAEKELETEEVDNSAFHVLNTNRRHDVSDQDYMLTHRVAAAFYDPWKYNINRIKKGDTVFLYENGVGIVAFGVGSGTTLMKDRYGDKDECHYQELSDFKILESPISAAGIRKVLDRNVVFLRTMSGMPDGQKILDEIVSQ